MSRKKPEPTPITGYRRKPITMEFTYPLPPDGDAEALKANVQINLTFGQLEDLPVGEDVTYIEHFESIAPFILGWNHTAFNIETGEYEPVPSPADAGPEVLKTLDHLEARWLINVTRRGHFRGESQDDQKNDSGPSESGPPQPNDSDSEMTA